MTTDDEKNESSSSIIRAPSMYLNEKSSQRAPIVDDAENGYVQELAPAKVDGIELHPKPTSDPLDPLNFSRFRKWTCLGIVMWMYFLFTYFTTTTVPSFTQLQDQYNITYSQVNWTVAIPALGLAVGPLIWSSPADIYGRRIIFIVGTVIALVATIGSAVAKSYGGYMAARFFQGLGVAPASTVGLAIINDLFFEHERGQKLGLWALAIDMGVLVGPLIGGFMTLVNQFWVAWLTAILFAVLLVVEIFFLPETLYPRSVMLARLERGEKSTEPLDMPRTTQLPWFNYRPVPGIAAPKPWDMLVLFGKLWTFPNVVIPVAVYCFTCYWWIMSIITMLPSAYVQYTPQIQGLLFLGLILGTLLSEILCSGTLSDRLIIRLSIRRGVPRTPEMRLWLVYPAVTSSTVGIILWGISIDRSFHWIVGQVAFFLFGAGIQIGNMAFSTYIIDCYPKQAMSVISWYAVLVNLGAFIDPFFIAPWQASQGWTWCFATQGIIAFFVMMPVTAAVQRWGGKMRAWRGEPGWTSSEYSL